MNKFEGRVCECCGNPELLAGVACCIAPVSILWCSPCIYANAQPIYVLETIGKEEIVHGFTYYDRETDTYKDFKTDEVLPFNTKDGTKEFRTRTELVNFVNNMEKK